jgi:hypothetical protein
VYILLLTYYIIDLRMQLMSLMNVEKLTLFLQN